MAPFGTLCVQNPEQLESNVFLLGSIFFMLCWVNISIDKTPHRFAVRNIKLFGNQHTFSILLGAGTILSLPRTDVYKVCTWALKSKNLYFNALPFKYWLVPRRLLTWTATNSSQQEWSQGVEIEFCLMAVLMLVRQNFVLHLHHGIIY